MVFENLIAKSGVTFNRQKQFANSSKLSNDHLPFRRIFLKARAQTAL